MPQRDETTGLEFVVNALGQRVGVPLADWKRPPRPPRTIMEGRTCRVEPLDVARHADELFAANALDEDGRGWTYLPYGPFADRAAYLEWMRATCLGDDPLFHAITDRVSGRAVGLASYLRIDPAAGSIEVGHLCFSPLLQRSVASTEAMYLMMKRAFELGYRRYEWKCDALNEPSRVAAERLGFTFEGVFRRAIVIKQRNRDTAWYSILDSEWPRLDAAFRRWLDPANFAADGTQRERLSVLSAR